MQHDNKRLDAQTRRIFENFPANWLQWDIITILGSAIAVSDNGGDRWNGIKSSWRSLELHSNRQRPGRIGASIQHRWRCIVPRGNGKRNTKCLGVFSKEQKHQAPAAISQLAPPYRFPPLSLCSWPAQIMNTSERYQSMRYSTRLVGALLCPCVPRTGARHHVQEGVVYPFVRPLFTDRELPLACCTPREI